MTVNDLKRREPEVITRLRQFMVDAPKGVSRAGERLQQFAKNQPVAATFAALAGGFLVGRIFSRR